MPFFNPLLNDKEFKRIYIRYRGHIEDVIRVFAELADREEELLVRRRDTITLATRRLSCKIYFNGRLVKLGSRIIRALEKEARAKRPYQLPIDLVIEARYKVSSKRRMKLRRDVIAVRIRKTKRGVYIMYAVERTNVMDPKVIVKRVSEMLKADVTESLSAGL